MSEHGGTPGGFDPSMFEHVPLFRELARVLSWSGGPVNWQLAAETAEAVVAQTSAEQGRLPSGGDDDRPQAVGAGFADAVETAELWLDRATALPARPGRAAELTGQQWLQQALSSDGLGRLVEPVARSLGEGLTEQVREQLGGEAEGLAGLGGQEGLDRAIASMGSMMAGVQVGTVAGHLAGQLLTCHELGVATTRPELVGTVSDNAERLAADFELDRTEVRHWLALREAASRRLALGRPWLRDELATLVERFASGAAGQAEQLAERLGGLGFDPSDPDALRDLAADADALEVEPTAEQQQVLRRVQTLIAVVSGWRELTVRRAADGRLPSLDRIEEVARRRRAERGSGERLLRQLIGLDLHAGDLRAGERFAEAVVDARGHDALERALERRSMLPAPEEVDEPSRWLVRLAAIEVDEELDDPQG